MNVTQVSQGQVLANISEQELELLQGCVEEALHTVGPSEFKDLLGHGTEEAKALMQQIAAAIDMIRHGAQPGAFGLLERKR